MSDLGEFTDLQLCNAAKCYLSNACSGQKSPPQTESGMQRNLRSNFLGYRSHLYAAAQAR